MYPRSNGREPDWGHPSRADSASDEAVNSALQRQKEFRALNQAFNDLEVAYRRLQASVPREALQRWLEQRSQVQANLEMVKNELNAISHNMASLIPAQSAYITEQLADLKTELETAQRELGVSSSADGPQGNS